jgi:putative hemolysin
MVIDLSSRLKHPLARGLFRIAAPLVERGLGIRVFNKRYERVCRGFAAHAAYPSAQAWFEAAASELGVQYEVDFPPVFALPAEGPLIVVSNHPFGLLDPIILGDLISQHRPYVRFMTNFLLGEMEEMRPWIIPVDPFGTVRSAARNLAPMKEALRFLRHGGALTIFPSGEVAHYTPGRGVQESAWSTHVGALVRRTQATVLPVYFDGRNSAIFHAAGLLHPLLRTTLLLRELFRRSRTKVDVRMGQPIPFARLAELRDDESVTRWLRLHTLSLSERPKSVVRNVHRLSEAARRPARVQRPRACPTGAPFEASDIAWLHRGPIWQLQPNGAYELATQDSPKR